MARPFIILACLFLSLFWCDLTFAQSLSFDMGDGPSFTGRMVQLVLILTVLSLAPSLLMMLTSFTRMVIVFSFLRSALGLQQSPPNTVLVSLALFMTAFVMGPTLQKSYDAGVAPYIQEKMGEEEAFDKASLPLKEFMLSHVREKDLGLFLDMSKETAIQKPEETPLKALVPAFMISELRRAFEIGFMIFLPFIIIDLVVASVLMSMGMMMVPPMMISLPFKVIFFVLVDGWHMLVGSLVKGFGAG
ncbi:MAG: flagellar type III secretion system pore protein FliP [Alphaproteobacteria bacterium]|jgi:flagellar biosynthetic protein FliP